MGFYVLADSEAARREDDRRRRSSSSRQKELRIDVDRFAGIGRGDCLEIVGRIRGFDDYVLTASPGVHRIAISDIDPDSVISGLQLAHPITASTSGPISLTWRRCHCLELSRRQQQ